LELPQAVGPLPLFPVPLPAGWAGGGALAAPGSLDGCDAGIAKSTTSTPSHMAGGHPWAALMGGQQHGTPPRDDLMAQAAMQQASPDPLQPQQALKLLLQQHQLLPAPIVPLVQNNAQPTYGGEGRGAIGAAPKRARLAAPASGSDDGGGGRGSPLLHSGRSSDDGGDSGGSFDDAAADSPPVPVSAAAAVAATAAAMTQPMPMPAAPDPTQQQQQHLQQDVFTSLFSRANSVLPLISFGSQAIGGLGGGAVPWPLPPAPDAAEWPIAKRDGEACSGGDACTSTRCGPPSNSGGDCGGDGDALPPAPSLGVEPAPSLLGFEMDSALPLMDD
jgi:hypothetical protein